MPTGRSGRSASVAEGRSRWPTGGGGARRGQRGAAGQQDAAAGERARLPTGQPQPLRPVLMVTPHRQRMGAWLPVGSPAGQLSRSSRFVATRAAARFCKLVCNISELQKQVFKIANRRHSANVQTHVCIIVQLQFQGCTRSLQAWPITFASFAKSMSPKLQAKVHTQNHVLQICRV